MKRERDACQRPPADKEGRRGRCGDCRPCRRWWKACYRALHGMKYRPPRFIHLTDRGW